MRIEKDCLKDFPASKSQLIRAFLCKSYSPHLEITNSSSAEDVVLASQATHLIAKNSSKNLKLDAGAAGAIFRFYCLRLSRIQGEHEISGTPRLLQRSHKALLNVLEQLNVGVERKTHSWILKVKTPNWESLGETKTLEVDMSESSQTATAVLLNAWNLDFDLALKLSLQKVSLPYWEMSLHLFRMLGGTLKIDGDSCLILKSQQMHSKAYTAEPDLSSVFSFVAAQIRQHDLSLKNFPFVSEQSDFAFIEVLQKMGVNIETSPEGLLLHRHSCFDAIEYDLSSCPDLFCSLAVLLGFSQGTSRLYGAPHLTEKESNRISAVAEIYLKLNTEITSLKDGVCITGRFPQVSQLPKLQLSAKDDHRVAMAIQILIEAGYPISIDNTLCVQKSFPQFFEILNSKSA